VHRSTNAKKKNTANKFKGMSDKEVLDFLKDYCGQKIQFVNTTDMP